MSTGTDARRFQSTPAAPWGTICRRGIKLKLACPFGSGLPSNSSAGLLLHGLTRSTRSTKIRDNTLPDLCHHACTPTLLNVLRQMTRNLASHLLPTTYLQYLADHPRMPVHPPSPTPVLPTSSANDCVAHCDEPAGSRRKSGTPRHLRAQIVWIGGFRAFRNLGHFAKNAKEFWPNLMYNQRQQKMVIINGGVFHTVVMLDV
ncbi:hypothetical protein N657DRAFT_389509 [Parathielavia appendiculata]|uniref:Uncharacterized protein n=1 Tax=Parathielavia appendiculata TaxID=2587402 RepID=A0AAN6U1S0_9PEZI|nr:hypothetical protein N657DRAFT_389509 [Parathielavia appendiculata]